MRGIVALRRSGTRGKVRADSKVHEAGVKVKSSGQECPLHTSWVKGRRVPCVPVYKAK